MSGRKDKICKKFGASMSMLAVLFVVSSCASSSSSTDAPPADTPPTDSQLLDDSSKVGATDVSDSSAFADLESKKTEETPAAAATSAPADGDTFYSSIGGESLRRVAFTLYSDKSFSKKLLEKNPDLKGVKKLSAEQKVFFDMDSAKPEPTYLTKDLLSRYTDSLASRLTASVTEKGITKTTVVVNKGETLQDVSQRLYGTHRYWTEIFLVNHEQIHNFDKVKPGMTLTVFNRPNTGIAKAEEAPVSPAKEERVAVEPPAKEVKPIPVVAPVALTTPEPTPVPVAPPVDSQPAPVPTPVAVQPKDPIPETPPAPAPAPVEVQKAAPPPPPLPVMEAKPIPPKPAEIAEPASANSSMRRILYVVLILAIGGAAFYFTRTPKRPKVDMLDLNADAGARPKLTPKDSQKHNIG